MSEQKTIKKIILTDEYVENSDSEGCIDESNEYNEIEEYEYTQDTINSLQSSLINYVTLNSISLCEYLDINAVENFLYSIK